ncbi:hypothetical protein LMG27952_06177 [Paraburkholderia hiiakae]|uniref:Uncharacterized protein n=1 Tax=Paraburkholderia hiiakae TaxID=1081782 RepID=A0ABM8P5C3_9BURK|nr:hypothetical protein [Paraburkholderia hiiakae]CAD6556720.1 hypothetical protein LMG27952_06177 [Paraburkholderia hiiakae]
MSFNSIDAMLRKVNVWIETNDETSQSGARLRKTEVTDTEAVQNSTQGSCDGAVRRNRGLGDGRSTKTTP